MARSPRRYPWYDSWWVARYMRARDLIAAARPGDLARFDDAFVPLHTSADFQTRTFDRLLDAPTLAEARRVVRQLRPTELELHEARNFGRFVVRAHPFFSELQARFVPLVSAAVGEAVEPSYNFVSLYTGKGICPVHLDAPSAKWTLDICLAQSEPWPIYFSQVQPWLVALTADWGDDWEHAIKSSPALRFEGFTLEPGQAVIFSGSSQWHYREPFPGGNGSCQLVFLHYIPRGTADLLAPATWAERFAIPELSGTSSTIE